MDSEFGAVSALIGGVIGIVSSLVTWGVREWWENRKRAESAKKSNMLALFDSSMRANSRIRDIRLALEPFHEGGPQAAKLARLPELERLAESSEFEALKLFCKVHREDAPDVYGYALDVAQMTTNLVFNFRPPDGFPRLDHLEITARQTDYLRACAAIWKSHMQLVGKVESQLRAWE